EAALDGRLQREVLGAVEVVALEDHLGAVPARLLDLHERRVARHHDGRGNSQALRVIGHALRVIARGAGDDAALALPGRERRELVERAAFLERCRELVVLELEVHLGPGDLRERARMQEGRLDHLAADHFGCGFDVLQGDRHWVNLKSTSGSRPEMISASALPEPAPMVQPSVPWPVFRYSPSKRVAPMSGTLEGVEG